MVDVCLERVQGSAHYLICFLLESCRPVRSLSAVPPVICFGLPCVLMFCAFNKIVGEYLFYTKHCLMVTADQPKVVKSKSHNSLRGEDFQGKRPCCVLRGSVCSKHLLQRRQWKQGARDVAQSDREYVCLLCMKPRSSSFHLLPLLPVWPLQQLTTITMFHHQTIPGDAQGFLLCPGTSPGRAPYVMPRSKPGLAPFKTRVLSLWPKLSLSLKDHFDYPVDKNSFWKPGWKHYNHLGSFLQ